MSLNQILSVRQVLSLKPVHSRIYWRRCQKIPSFFQISTPQSRPISPYSRKTGPHTSHKASGGLSLLQMPAHPANAIFPEETRRKAIKARQVISFSSFLSLLSFTHLSRRFLTQLPVLPALPLFLPGISAPEPFSGSAPSACSQAGTTGWSYQMPLRSAKRS